MPQEQPVSIMFMTDLDGTLLGHEDFGFRPIRDGLLDLIDSGIKIVPNSSKTRREIDSFCSSLGARLPYVFENGAGIGNTDLMAPMAMRRTPGNPRGTSLKNLKSIWDRSISLALRDECRFLADMPPHDQSRHLGLRGNALALAMKREYTAPFVFSGNAKAFAELVNEAKTAGLAIKRGGRVCNLSGRHDKAGYNFALRSAYRDVGSRLCIVGFGDGENDIEMLQQADIACVIPRPGAKAMDLPHPPSRVITASQAAPHGWIEAAMKALSTIKVREGYNYG
ncbi:MAG: HAD hydrolase family protein [Pseudomonadota bacterium]|nr:HAD hydrolase family protein [Pseudomonadota bacterium]MEC8549200.1 HAD hydrolase family protein [Pseudomonadota bacterium]